MQSQTMNYGMKALTVVGQEAAEVLTPAERRVVILSQIEVMASTDSEGSGWKAQQRAIETDAEIAGSLDAAQESGMTPKEIRKWMMSWCELVSRKVQGLSAFNSLDEEAQAKVEGLRDQLYEASIALRERCTFLRRTKKTLEQLQKVRAQVKTTLQEAVVELVDKLTPSPDQIPEDAEAQVAEAWKTIMEQKNRLCHALEDVDVTEGLTACYEELFESALYEACNSALSVLIEENIYNAEEKVICWAKVTCVVCGDDGNQLYQDLIRDPSDEVERTRLKDTLQEEGLLELLQGTCLRLQTITINRSSSLQHYKREYDGTEELVGPQMEPEDLLDEIKEWIESLAEIRQYNQGLDAEQLFNSAEKLEQKKIERRLQSPEISRTRRSSGVA